MLLLLLYSSLLWHVNKISFSPMIIQFMKLFCRSLRPYPISRRRAVPADINQPDWAIDVSKFDFFFLMSSLRFLPILFISLFPSCHCIAYFLGEYLSKDILMRWYFGNLMNSSFVFGMWACLSLYKFSFYIPYFLIVQTSVLSRCVHDFSDTVASILFFFDKCCFHFILVMCPSNISTNSHLLLF